MSINQEILFDMRTPMPTMGELLEQARATLRGLYASRAPVFIAFSGGKDSTVLADIAITTARDYFMQTGVQPSLTFTTSDTGIENPEVHEHFQRDLIRLRKFAQRNGFSVTTAIAKPSLLNTFVLKVLGGRGLPSFPGTNTDCAVEWKVQPQQKLRARLYAEIEAAGMLEPVTCIGTRFDESAKRSLSMRIRQESATTPVRNKDGDLVLSPICDFSTDDVFEYLGTRQPTESYSDFKDTLRLYAHAESTSCAVVAASIQEGMSKPKRGGCGARHGCSLCQQAVDKSLENMIAFDERYHYAAGLNKLNKFIRNTRYDWRRRNWVGRTIKAGWIAIQPDTYHPSMVRELFRYMVQLQYDESVRAQRVGGPPKFELLSEKMILALDAYWSLTGLARPFSAWADVDAIYSGRERYDVPDVELFPVTEMPAARFIYVGDEWDETLPSNALQGLRSAYHESLLEISACAPEIRTVKSTGREIWKGLVSPSFEVHDESLEMITQFEMDRMLEMHRQDALRGNWLSGSVTHGYKWYVQYGALSMAPALAAQHDYMLRRTAHKESLGLLGDYDIDELLGKSTGFADLPDGARRAWSKKATTASSQLDLCLSD